MAVAANTPIVASIRIAFMEISLGQGPYELIPVRRSTRRTGISCLGPYCGVVAAPVDGVIVSVECDIVFDLCIL